MKRPLELPEEHEAARAALEAEEQREDVDSNAWKRDEWRDGEVVGEFWCRAQGLSPLVIRIYQQIFWYISGSAHDPKIGGKDVGACCALVNRVQASSLLSVHGRPDMNTTCA